MGVAVKRTRGLHSHKYCKENEASTVAESCLVLLCSCPLIPMPNLFLGLSQPSVQLHRQAELENEFN